MSPWANQDEMRDLSRRLATVRFVQPTRKAKRKTREYTNPWKLPPSIERTLQAVIQTGSEREAAVIRGVGVRTVEHQMRLARLQMESPNRVLCLLTYDRWKREQC